MAESNTFTGVISSVRDTYQKLTSADLFSKSVQWSAFNKSPFMQAVGLEAFGVEAVKDASAFGAAKPTGRILRYDSGAYGLRGAVWDTGPTSFHAGRLSNFTPSLVEGGDEWGYSWHRIAVTEYIPDVDVQDNGSGRLFDIKALKMEGMKQSFVRDFNYGILGHTSAPDYGVLGPTAVYTDVPNIVSVTQSRSVGGITKSASTFWSNTVKAVTSVGGGTEMDRPLALRRGLLDVYLTAMNYAESTPDYLILTTQGGFQYMDRLMYADSVQSGNGGAFGSLQRYDAAGIDHFAFKKQPIVWDPAATVPYGATASTEFFAGIHVPKFFISIRSEENFKASDWEQPREHDTQKTLVGSIKTRYTPGVTGMRTHWLAYNVPACPD